MPHRFLAVWRLRLLLILAVLVGAGAGTAGLYVWHASQPHPERFAAGVVASGAALEHA